MNITRLILHNYRCFKYLSIDFHAQLTVLVANNGGGKTSILDAVAVAFGPYVGAFDEGVNTNFKSSDIHLIREYPNGMARITEGVHLTAEGYFSSQNNARLESWKRSLNNSKTRTTNKDARLLAHYGKSLKNAIQREAERKYILSNLRKISAFSKIETENPFLFTDFENSYIDNPLLPLIAYYGTGRLWQVKKIMGNPLNSTSRTVGYSDCLNPASQYKKFIAWFTHWIQCAFQESRAATKLGEPNQRSEFDDYLDNIRNALNTCLKDTGWFNLDFDFKKGTVVATHEKQGTLAVSQLSDGIRNMIGMVADIAFRATKLNGHLGTEAVLKTNGIVLIDEIDMHLHPEWQQTVLQGFTKAFPLIQFIVTTHSPQVLSTVRKENIRVLLEDPENDGIYEVNEPEFSPLAHPSSDALALIMDVFPTPDLLEDDLQQYEQYVLNNQEDSLIAQEIRKRLDDVGYEFHESDLSKWRFIASRKKANGV
jgi:predicted ATP-binding protein involved in virulence